MLQVVEITEAVESIREGGRVVVHAAAGEVFRWRMSRGNLVIDKPSEKEYALRTADAG